MDITLVTCSYAPDLGRCQRLSRTIERHVPGSIEHLVLVPRRDQAMFERALGDRSRVVTVESILPAWLRQVPFSRKWWLTPWSPPVRGWICQQLVKLSACYATQSPVMVFVDSDVIFVRALEPSQLVQDGKVRLHRQPGEAQSQSHQRWHRAAGRLLGIEATSYFGSDYIGQLVSWRRECLIELHERLEAVAKRDWRGVLCRTLHFSEYILYGVFVEHVLGDEAGHFYDDRELCHCSWHYEIEGEHDLEFFVDDLQPDQCAVLVQSNLGLTDEQTSAGLSKLDVDVAV